MFSVRGYLKKERNRVAFFKMTVQIFLNAGGTKRLETQFIPRRFQISPFARTDIRLQGVSTLRNRPIEALSVRDVIDGVDAYLSPARCDRSRDKIHLELCHKWVARGTGTVEGRDVAC